MQAFPEALRSQGPGLVGVREPRLSSHGAGKGHVCPKHVTRGNRLWSRLGAGLCVGGCPELGKQQAHWDRVEAPGVAVWTATVLAALAGWLERGPVGPAPRPIRLSTAWCSHLLAEGTAP